MAASVGWLSAVPAWAGNSAPAERLSAGTQRAPREGAAPLSPPAVSPQSSESFPSDVPPAARSIATLLHHTAGVFSASIEGRQAIKQLRADQDGLNTKRAAVSTELGVLAQHQQQLQQQLVAVEAEREAQLESLRKDLEAKLDQGLAAAGQQIDQELAQELTQRVQGFETRQRTDIGKLLDQDIQLQERELHQLSQEVEMQTKELSHRLAQLDANPDVVNAMSRSASEAVAKRKTALDARRSQLQTERDTRLAQQRAEYVGRVKQQQAMERQRRVTLKEASLRQAMAELLHNTHLQENARLEQLHGIAGEAKQRSSQLAQEQTSLSARVASLDKEIAAHSQRVNSLDTEQQASLARLEQAFEKSDLGARGELLAWFGHAISQLPPDLASELGSLQQRLVAQAEQERQLWEQQRVLRERQLAMQLSREMESQRQAAMLNEQREQEARAQKADGLLAKAKQVADRGKFDDALQLLAQAQGLNPPQIAEVTAAREQVLAAKEGARAMAQKAQTERLFNHAMEVFQGGRYGEAVALFEQVIAQEASQERSVRFAEDSNP